MLAAIGDGLVQGHRRALRGQPLKLGGREGTVDRCAVRPSGGLGGQASAGRPARPFAFGSRYPAERVTADLELGFFFPGAASQVRAPAGPVELPR